MKEMKHYISLKLKGENAYHKNRTHIKSTEPIINIGETVDCDVRYDSHGLQPEYYASIIKNEDGRSWRIVKRSQYTDISIAGKGSIGYAHQLKDGDLIQFSEQSMVVCFHIHYDDHYDEDGTDDAWQWAVTGLLSLVAIISIIWGLNQLRKNNISTQDVEALEEAIFRVRVDSVCQILFTHDQEQQLSPMKKFTDEAPTGTAFFTTDGKMVTARHCVEYWIGTNLDLTTKVSDLSEDDIVRWAIETETFNQTHQKDSIKQLRVFFSLYDFMGDKRYSFASSDQQVHINTERDGVFMLADFDQNYYWRTVRPYFTDRQMELGDILWIDGFEEKGKVVLAKEKDWKHVKNGATLMICGYPMTGIGDKRMTSTEGVIRRAIAKEKENLFIEGNINHGFSGGPVLIKSGNEVVAIGVVSRVDSVSSGLYKWAVPVTEVKN